jgi:hypothetical protein
MRNGVISPAHKKGVGHAESKADQEHLGISSEAVAAA